MKFYLALFGLANALNAGVIARSTTTVETICVESIPNLSHRAVNMDGINDELVAQLQKLGFQSHTISGGLSGCDAIVNAELVEISGRRRKGARVDFRLTLVSEQLPRISSSAVGKSRKGSPLNGRLSTTVFAFAATSKAEAQTAAEREAIFAALEQQARQIESAYERGLPPWLPAQP